MTDDSTLPAENVGRGTSFSLLSILAGIALFAIVAAIFSFVDSYLVFVAGIAAYVVPFIGAWLYVKGAGAPLARGRLAFTVVSVIAIAVSAFTGILVSTFISYTRVGGDGGMFSSVFWTTMRNQFANNFENVGIPVIIGLGLGIFGLVAVLRGGTLGRKTAPVPAESAAPDLESSVPPVPNAPSPGVILNGKPLDPGKK
jgi:cation transport ATPase